MTKVTVKVPATTANLGPGYDCLGMALDIWNTVEAQVVPAGSTRVTIEGEGATELPSSQQNLVYQSMARLWHRLGKEPPPLALRCCNAIPLCRGLGSSSAAIVGGLVAANHLLDQPSSQEELLAMATQVEGHPDNVTPALLGGLQIVASDGDGISSSPVPIPHDLTAVLFVPDTAIATRDARSVLPQQVSREDAVFNLARVAMLVNAMASSRLEDLALATADRLHQPHRQQLFPAMKLLFQGAMIGGALGVFLSGSGSTVLALTRGKEMTVAYEMAEAARRAGVPGSIRITRPSPQGAHLV